MKTKQKSSGVLVLALLVAMLVLVAPVAMAQELDAKSNEEDAEAPLEKPVFVTPLSPEEKAGKKAGPVIGKVFTSAEKIMVSKTGLGMGVRAAAKANKARKAGDAARAAQKAYKAASKTRNAGNAFDSVKKGSGSRAGSSKGGKTGAVGRGFTQTFKDTAKSKIGREEFVKVDELYTRQHGIGNYDYYTDKFKIEGPRSVEPVSIVEVNGRKIISNGNHRLMAAREAGVAEIRAVYDDAARVAKGWGDETLENFYQKSHKGDKYYERWG